MTLKERIIQMLQTSDHPLTACQLNAKLNNDLSSVKLSSISSLLCKFTKDGTVERHDTYGVRGGYGYSLRER